VGCVAERERVHARVREARARAGRGAGERLAVEDLDLALRDEAHARVVRVPADHERRAREGHANTPRGRQWRERERSADVRLGVGEEDHDIFAVACARQRQARRGGAECSRLDVGMHELTLVMQVLQFEEQLACDELDERRWHAVLLAPLEQAQQVLAQRLAHDVHMHVARACGRHGKYSRWKRQRTYNVCKGLSERVQGGGRHRRALQSARKQLGREPY
jgi:hypothetical protein